MKADTPAQETPDGSEPASSPRTLFGGGPLTWGGYLGPSVQATTMDQKSAILVGLEGGLLFNRTVVIGAAGNQLVSKNERFLGGPLFIMRYGGAAVRYQYPSDSIVYGSLGVLLGGGSVDSENRPATDAEEERSYSPDGFFVVEPSLQVHLNFTRWMRAGLQVSYRIVNGVEDFNLTERDMSAPSFGAHIQFGWF